MSTPIASNVAEPQPRIRIWDLPTRLFHWMLALAFAAQWLTQDDGRLLDYHVFAGYAIGVLILLRLVWGLVGTRYARFTSFAAGARRGWQHLSALLAGRHQRYLGHNPAGAWSIFGLLLLGAATVITGVATLGGAKQLGPLRGLIGYARGDALAIVHKYLAWSMLALVAAHVVGVLVTSRIERENLTLSMLVGTKRAMGELEGVAAALPVALVMLIVAVAAAWVYFRGYATAESGQPYLPFSQAALVQSEAWDKECGGCHLAYHPSVLPAPAWRALLDEQHAHFGEDLGLEESTVDALRAYMRPQSAEAHATPLAWKIDSTTRADATPRRVTETDYWKKRHATLSAADWNRTKRFACEGCHLDAAAGTFLPGAIHVGTTSVGAENGK